MSPLSFDNGWTDRNVDCCINNVDEKMHTATKLVNFGLVFFEILCRICMDDESTKAKIHCALVFKGHSPDGSSIASL